MTSKRLYQAMGIAAALACTGATAQMYKCKGPDGKIVYSDTACEPAATGSAIKVIPMGTTPSEREKAMADEAAKKAEDAKKAAERKQLVDEVAAETAKRMGGGAPAAAAAPEPYKVTGADRERVRELEMQANSLGATAEQKQAARMQISRIQRGADARMSSADRERRDALMTDLSSVDKEKRARALRELQSSYN
ncbi:MAG: DUF4124 domain-containing protein [Burkholderiales bacterium]|nr:DUF4124 domain-containing protein [Burkholderiales bacterium]